MSTDLLDLGEGPDETRVEQLYHGLLRLQRILLGDPTEEGDDKPGLVRRLAKVERLVFGEARDGQTIQPGLLKRLETVEAKMARIDRAALMLAGMALLMGLSTFANVGILVAILRGLGVLALP
jgi:hypothetical protein